VRREKGGYKMKSKELLRLLVECEGNLNVYVQYEGSDSEIGAGDTFKIKELEYDGQVIILTF
jgi:hypothetical protein